MTRAAADRVRSAPGQRNGSPSEASVDDRDRHVHALDADAGERRWTFAGHDRLTELLVGEERAYLAGARAGLLRGRTPNDRDRETGTATPPADAPAGVPDDPRPTVVSHVPER